MTHDDFRFYSQVFPLDTPEMWLAETEKELYYLFDVIRPLCNKPLVLLLQLLSFLTPEEGLKKLQRCADFIEQYSSLLSLLQNIFLCRSTIIYFIA